MTEDINKTAKPRHKEERMVNREYDEIHSEPENPSTPGEKKADKKSKTHKK